MKRFIIRIIIIFLIGVFQSSFFNLFSIGRSAVKPNFLLLMIIFYALSSGCYEGAITGFWAGLAQDIISGKILGVYAAIGLVAGLLIGLLKERIYRDNAAVNALLVFIITILYELAVALCIGTNIWGRGRFFYCFFNIIFIEALYNAVMSLWMFKVMNKIKGPENGYMQIKREVEPYR